MGINSRSTVGTAVDTAPLLRLLFSRIGHPSAGRAYSFNHPMGMCPDCTGLGEKLTPEKDSLFDRGKTLREGAALFSQFASGWQADLYLTNLVLDPDKKLCDFTEKEWRFLYDGFDETVKIEIRSNETGRVDTVAYEGVIPRFERLYMKRDITKLKKGLQREILSHVYQAPCPTCGGTGFNPKALASRIDGRNIIDYMAMSVSELWPALAERLMIQGGFPRETDHDLSEADDGCRHRIPHFGKTNRYPFRRPICESAPVNARDRRVKRRIRS
ncbi:hypothetical protein [Pseudoramibacter faecis]|uniref:hypothetical protein n=1 Tax=Pseudoramibacter faecis TaxID=3108534 RepID=UPI002E78D582|nr:hypothetical protein [Pseudoramibacter sp. HA2172]